MKIILGIVIIIAWLVSGLFTFYHSGRDRDLYDKLTKDERNYVHVLETHTIIVQFALLIIGGVLISGEF